MSGFEDSKQQILKRLLENASLTDGLSDEDAQSLLSWCELESPRLCQQLSVRCLTTVNILPDKPAP